MCERIPWLCSSPRPRGVEPPHSRWLYEAALVRGQDGRASQAQARSTGVKWARRIISINTYSIPETESDLTEIRKKIAHACNRPDTSDENPVGSNRPSGSALIRLICSYVLGLQFSASLETSDPAMLASSH
jgi:hypothetical protein